MDIDERSVGVYCSKCNEIRFIPLEEFPPENCCNTQQFTFGLPYCSAKNCKESIPIDPSTLDLCLACNLKLACRI